METMAKPAQLHRSTDRLIEALSTLAALLDRTIHEVKALDSEFQSRLQQAVHETEVALQRHANEHLQQVLQEADQKVRSQVSEQMMAQFQTEMALTVEKLRTELEGERDRLNWELDRANQASVKWDEERSRLLAQCDQARQTAADAKSAQERAEAQAAELAAAQAAVPADTGIPEAIEAEISRIETLIRNISRLIDDPTTELATVIRKNVERAELDSYLRGIRFAFNGK
jgi:hypothetical protein